MSRVRKLGRSTLALLAACTVASTQGCYGARPEPRHIQWAGDVEDLGPATKTIVGRQRSVQQVSSNSGSLLYRVEEVPICAERRMGEAEVVATIDKDVRRWVTVPVRLMFLGGAAVTAGYGALAVKEGETTKGAAMLATGILGSLLSLFIAERPATKTAYRKRMMPVAQFIDSYDACGPTQPVSADVKLAFAAGERQWETVVHSDRSGDVAIDPALLRDVETWAAACNQPVQLSATLGERDLTLASLRGSLHGEQRSHHCRAAPPVRRIWAPTWAPRIFARWRRSSAGPHPRKRLPKRCAIGPA